MPKLKLILVISAVVLTLSTVETQSAERLLPNFAVVPVEQDAPWAVEWWRDRHDAKTKEAGRTEAKLLFVGDSITHGWEDKGAEVWREYYQSRNAFNLGFAGDRTEHVLWRLDHGAVDGMNPTLVVLLIGTNNTGQRMDPAVYTAEGIERIVTNLRMRLPGTRVLVVGIFPRHISPLNEMRKRNEEVNRLISRLDNDDSVQYLDIGLEFVTEDGTIRKDLMPDLLHPNAAGYRVWAEAMEPAIERMMRN